jgi:hypothetical protein
MDEKKKKQIEKNLLLKAKVAMLGGELHNSEDSDLPMEIKNQFLQNIIDFEEAPVKPITEILNTKPEDWPDEKELDDKQIEKKLKELIKLLHKHNMVLAFANKLPMRTTYSYVTREFLEDEITAPVDGMTLSIDGCNGNCEDCFQLDYCDTGKDILGK